MESFGLSEKPEPRVSVLKQPLGFPKGEDSFWFSFFLREEIVFFRRQEMNSLPKGFDFHMAFVITTINANRCGKRY